MSTPHAARAAILPPRFIKSFLRSLRVSQQIAGRPRVHVKAIAYASCCECGKAGRTSVNSYGTARSYGMQVLSSMYIAEPKTRETRLIVGCKVDVSHRVQIIR